MRQLTAYASYLDNLGAPLVGRARFCNMDKSPAVVYGLDNGQTPRYVPIGSTVYTNSSGQLVPQVFLADHDYLIFFDKYIGSGTMSEDDDPESWPEQGSAVDKYNTVGIELDGSAVRSFGTVDALRAALPVESADGDDEIVELLGYNEPGDKPSIQYQWDPDSSEPDNGGSVLGTGAVGRWKLVECPEFLDVRHFGAFPAQTSSENVNQRNAIQLAGVYAHTNGCGLYFTGTSLAAFYDITNLELYDVASDDTACVFAIKNGNDDIMATVRNVVNIKCATDQDTAFADQGRIQLTGDVLRTSYAPDYRAKLVPSQRLIVDSVLKFSKIFNDIIVECHVPLTDDGDTWSLTSCIVISNFANEAGWGSASSSIMVNGASASMILTALTLIGMTVGGNASIGGNLAIGGSLKFGPYEVSHEYNGTYNKLLLKNGYSTVLQFTEVIAKFFGRVDFDVGWKVNDDNFLMQPRGETEIQLWLKLPVKWDLTAYNGSTDDIKFDRLKVTAYGDIRRLNTNSIYAFLNNSIMFGSGAYRYYGAPTHITINNSSASYGLPLNTTYKHFIYHVQSSSPALLALDAFVQDNIVDGEIICIENGGWYVDADITVESKMDIVNKGSSLIIYGFTTNKVIDTVRPGTRKYFKANKDNGLKFEPCSL